MVSRNPSFVVARLNDGYTEVGNTWNCSGKATTLAMETVVAITLCMALGDSLYRSSGSGRCFNSDGCGHCLPFKNDGQAHVGYEYTKADDDLIVSMYPQGFEAIVRNRFTQHLYDRVPATERCRKGNFSTAPWNAVMDKISSSMSQGEVADYLNQTTYVRSQQCEAMHTISRNLITLLNY